MHFWDYIEDANNPNADVKSKEYSARMVAASHYVYRNFMGSVDQSDVKSVVMGLCTERVSAWHRKQLPYLIEAAIIWAHANYNLDASTTKPEFFTEWHNQFICELLEMSPNLRKYNLQGKTPVKKRKLILQEEQLSRSHKKKRQVKKQKARGRKLGLPTKAGITCYGRQNLAKYLRFYPKSGTEKNFRPRGQRLKCDFCGRDRIMHKCLACGEVFCMAPPHNLLIPESDPPQKFASNGLFCWHLVHGYGSWNEL